jgi:1-aminocyclopropane-1-carboxylate deaminase
MELPGTRNISTDRISVPIAIEKKITLEVLRLDKIDPLISGNKWFKLKPFLEEARLLNKHHILTFGGAWSNHLLATAAACNTLGYHATGIVRGERPAKLPYPLQAAADKGMELVFTDRTSFRRQEIPEIYDKNLYYVIPAGGCSDKGIEGAADIANQFADSDYTHIACATGTGTTFAGLIKASGKRHKIIGIPVLKNEIEIQQFIREKITDPGLDCEIIPGYHFGGYARHNKELIMFMNDLYEKTAVPSDFVYTGKLFFAIHDLVSKNYFQPGSKILIIHSGGLTGNHSLPKGTLIF